MAIIVRKGEEKDFPVLLELIKELATFEKNPEGSEHKIDNTVTNSLELMKKEKKFFGSFVADDDGKIVGYAIYFFAYYTWVGKSLYLEDIYMKPEFRNKKIGSMLLRKVFELARRENCKRIRWQVLRWNKNAIGFYKKRGAAISDAWLNCDFDEDEINSFLQENR